jgi:diaminohydroxyphosphoribosylaminopyrimidine deaminase / 5-amino-6-(5-phosphoribosylamino)uracil reductase
VVGVAPRDDVRWMERALALAERGLGRTTPNPVVGACIVTDDGVVVGHGAHERAGEPHAEVHALNEAGARARGATLFCTLEPCAHTGRTGPCTERIVQAGVRRVVCAVEDPDPRVQGRGFAILRSAGLVVDVGICREAAARLNQPFFLAMSHRRPFVIAKAATSLDGRVAEMAGCRTRLTSAAANRRTQFIRARVDAVAIGSETLAVDDPVLTVRDVYRERPLVRVVFDRRLRTSPEARVLSTLHTGPVIILTSQAGASAAPDRARALERAGATLVIEDEPGLAPMLRRLVSFDIHSVLLEGGRAVHAAAWDEGLVDYVQIYVTPHVLGESGVPLAGGLAAAIPSLVDARVMICGPDASIEGYVHRLD